MISPEIIEEIRQKANIVDVISSYIEVIKKGNSYLAVCPFHNDKNPSLHISTSKQIFKCFSCGKGGNVFTFVQDYEKIPFIDAVRKVANLIGFHSDELDKTVRAVDNSTKQVLSALKEASVLYSFTLKTNQGTKGAEYLKKRNISEDMSDYFSLGYCPEDGESSIKILRAKNISIESLDKAGIVVRENNRFLDRFKGRVIFPLFNEYDEVVGFSARRINDSDEAKYVNSINTDVFNKSKVLYNYQNALKEAHEAGYVYVTEGFMDVFALYQSGIKSSVALMGTAFTKEHAKLLKKLNVEVRLCLDGDEAGQHGMLKMLDILESEKIKYRIVNYKDCLLDPDEILQKYGSEVLKKFSSRLFERDDFVFQYYLKKYDLKTSDGKRDFSNQLVDYASKLKNPIDREILLKKISEKTGISYESYVKITNQLEVNTEKEITKKNNEKVSIPVNPVENKKSITKLQRCEDKIISLLLNYPDAIYHYRQGNNYFIDEIYSAIADYIIDNYELNNNQFDVSKLITTLSQKDDDISKKALDKIVELQDIDPRQGYSDKLLDESISAMKEIIDKETLNERLKGKSPQEQAQIIQTFWSTRR